MRIVDIGNRIGIALKNIALALALGAGSAGAAIPVGAGGSGTLSLDTLPAATEWSCLSIGGTGATATDLASLDAAVNGVAAASFGTLPSITVDPTASEAVGGAWNSVALRLTSRPTGNAAAAIMATLQNTAGTAISELNIHFTLSGSGTDTELPGYVLYYSLTGASGSWQRIGICSTLGAVAADNIVLNSAWANGASLYVMWVDDNANGSGDYWYGIDDVSIAKSAPAANMLTFGPGASISDTTIAWSVPHGSNLATLAPTFTLSPGATCNQPNGAVPSPDFSTGPVHYIVTSSDSLVQKDYTVTVTVLPDFIMDGLVLWLKADAINTGDANQVRSAGGNLYVQQWTDQSGNGRNAANADTSTQPQYLAGDLNGLPTVKWDGTGKFLEGQSAATIKTIFAVCKKDAEATGLDGMFCQSHNADSQNIRGNGSNWNQTGYNADGNDFPNNGEVYVNGTSGHVHNGLWHVLNEVSASSPSFTYQLGQQAYSRYFNGRIAEFIAYNRELTSDEKNAVGAYLAVKYGLETAYVSLPQAKITSFGPGAAIGALSGNAAAVTWSVPNGTDVTTLAPTFTLSTGATCTVNGVAAASGETRDFTNPVAYVVTSSDLAITNTYTVTVRILPPGPPVTGYTRWFDAAPLGLADNAPVTLWNDYSGNGAHATVPTGNATPVFVATSGMEGGLGAIYFAGNGGAAASGALKFTRDSGIRTVFSVFKGNSFLLTDQDTYHFHRSEGGATDTDPATAIWGHDASGYVTNGQTYVNGVLQNYPALVDSNNTMPTNLHNGFNLVEVVTTGAVQADSFNKDRGNTHAGDQYQAEVIIYDRVLSTDERMQVERYLMSKWFAVDYSAQIVDFGVPGIVGVIDQTAKTITMTVPYSTDLAGLNPTFTLTSGTCDQTSGSPPSPSFAAQNPATYTVTDGATVNSYAVTITVAPPDTAKVMSNVHFPGLGYAHPTDSTGTSFALQVVGGTPVNALAPTYDKSPLAGGDPASGTSLDFSTPQAYVVTAEDGSQQVYTVAVAPYTGYEARVMASSPFAYWPMNEGLGFVAYDNASSHNGSYRNSGVTLGVAGPAGENAARFSGADAVAMQIPQAAALCPDGSFSVEIWVMPAAIPQAPTPNPAYVAANVNLGSNRDGWYLAQDDGSVFGVGNAFVVRMFNRNGSNRACQLYAPIDTVRWYHLVLTFDAGTNIARLYEDGVTNETDQYGMATLVSYYGNSSTNPFTVAKRSDGAWPWAGTAAHLAFYTRTLTPQEILNHLQLAPGYTDWAAQYAGGGMPNEDYNNDGVANGIAFFMGENGVATNPGVIDGKVTWPHVNTVTSFGVEVSDNLADWSPATTGVDLSDPTKVVFTLPTGAAKKFCRLMVVP